MKVCIVTTRYPPNGGGAAASVRMRLDGLQACGVSGMVLTLAYDDGSATETVAGFEIKRLSRLFGKIQTRPLEALQAFHSIIHYRKKFDIVNIVGPNPFFSIGASLAAIVLKKCLVIETTLIGQDDPISSSKHRIGWLYNFIIRRADAVVGKSTALVKKAQEFGLPDTRIFHIPNSVDTSLFHPVVDVITKTNLRKVLKLPIDRMIVVYVGFLTPRKGIHLIIDAIKMLTGNVKLPYTLMIGNATNNKDQDYVNDLNLSIEIAGLASDIKFLGKIEDRNTLSQYLRASDIFVLPSSREGFPMSTLEAMASGLCPILTDLPGITDDIARDGENAVIIQRTVEELARSFEMCLRDEQFTNKIGISARETVLEKYTTKIVMEQYTELYKNISNSKNG